MRCSAYMKKLQDEIMIAAMKDAEDGMRIPDICSKHKISESAYYRFKKKYSGLNLNEINQVRRVETEENTLKRRVKEQDKIIKALQAALKKKF